MREKPVMNTNISDVPKVMFPLIQLPGGGPDVEQKDSGIALNQPMTVNNLAV